MSRENVEVVRRRIEAFQEGIGRGDPGAFVDSEEFADDCEWRVPPPGLDGRTVWRGREGFVEFARTWTEEFEGWRLRLDRLVDAGNDRVVALTYQSATGRASGVPVELKVGQVYEFELRRIARVTNYLSHPRALEAAGLSE
jgi:ketosteroid isomerase-like protein